MNKNLKKGGKPANEHHLSLQLMHKYLEDNLPATQMYYVEKHLLDCELCADALEGISFVREAEETEKSIDHLKHKVRKRSLRDPVIKKRRKLIPLHWKHISVAAATLIMLVGSILVFKLNTPKKPDSAPVAVTQRKVTEGVPSSPDLQAPVQSDAQASSPQENKSTNLSRIKQKQPVTPPPAAQPQTLMDAQENVSLSPEVAIDQIEEQIKAEESVASNESMQSAPREVIAEAKSKSSDIIQEKRMPMPSGAVGITQNFITVSGKVVRASDSTALSGATVSIKNTSKIAVTDYSGRFSMAVPPNSALIVNFEGMSEQEVAVSGRKTLNIALRPEGEKISLMDSTKESISGTAEEDNLSYKPQPADGAMKYRSYLKKNLQYPSEAKSNKIEGTVRVDFTVQKDGKLTNFNIRKSLGYGCDEEAIRLIKEGPAWKPAIANGQAVERKTTVYVPFKL